MMYDLYLGKKLVGKVAEKEGCLEIYLQYDVYNKLINRKVFKQNEKYFLYGDT